MLSPEVPEPPDAGAPQTVTIVPLAYIATGTVFTSPAESVIPLYHPRPSSGAARTALSEGIAVLSYSSTSTVIRVPGGIPPISPRPSERRNHFSIGAKCGAEDADPDPVGRVRGVRRRADRRARGGGARRRRVDQLHRDGTVPGAGTAGRRREKERREQGEGKECPRRTDG